MFGPLHSHLILAFLLFYSFVTVAENSERAITLHVIDAETGKPVAGAEVRRGKPDTFGIRPPPAPEVSTDAAGKARWKLFPSAGEPDTSLTITHPGYPSLSAVRIPRDQFAVEQNRREILIKLQRGVRIGGVVKDAEGRPVANARVLIQAGDPPITYARSYAGLFQQRLFVSMVSGDVRSPIVRTDLNGRWSFTNAPPEADLYVIKVRREDGSESVFGTEFAQYDTLFHVSQLGLPEVFGPGYPITPVSLADLRAGNVVTTLAHGYVVQGRILDQRGKPVPQARVRESYRRSDAESGSEVLTDSQGRFEFRNRHAGEVAYNIDATGYALSTVFATIASNTPAIVARLEPARPARVQVLWDNQRPALGAKVMASPNDHTGYQGSWSQIVDANGVVVWSNAPAPRAFVWVVGTNDAPVQLYIKPGELTRVILTNNPPRFIAPR